MAPLVVVLILGAALLHATWNALLRSGADRLASITVMSVMSGAAAGITCLVVPLPAPAAWPFVFLSAALQIAYCLFLVRAYAHGQLSQVYPIARGSAPLLVALGAALAAGERPTPAALAGLVMVSAGIIGLSLGRDRPHLSSTLAALAAGALIAAYMVSDGLGVRWSGNAVSYVAWMSLAQGAPMPFVYLVLRRRWPPIGRDRETLKALAGGLLSLVGYGIVVWALTGSQMARVSGLRETSILFAALIGVVFLKEPLTLRRSACAIAITAGVILLAT
jgi:drug/metabolite transporter (DMT)-like permease